ncbi:MAG: hypothetical protein ACLSVG_05245 [Clostridia bacterium]
MKKMWLKNGTDNIDLYAAFRGTFYSETEFQLSLSLSGCSWFRVFWNGEFLTEGPYRYDDSHPAYATVPCRVRRGKNVILAVVHSDGVPTRMLMNTAPFFSCDAPGIEILWKCTVLEAYQRKLRRINPELGWMECCSIENLPQQMEQADFDDSRWEMPDFLENTGDPYGAFTAAAAKPVARVELAPALLEQGVLMQRFGYEYDDVPAAFYLRALHPADPNDVEGIWLRYDLQKICLFSFEAEITAPAGTILEAAYSETLFDGRVSPYITLSAGPSCNLDRYLLKEGRQQIGNLTPRGGRYVEIHILGDVRKITLHACRFRQRTYFPEILGSFSCGDALLDKIWKTGAVTLQSCAEDAITDNPTRERGEWTGDAVSAPLEIIAAAFGDFSLIRRALIHSADCAAEDGCVAGLAPGGGLCVSSYALQWVSACRKYFTNTGDREFYTEMYPHALKNMSYFQKHYVPGTGLDREIYWLFIDWGYVTNSGPSDLAADLFLLDALRTMCSWSVWMSDPEHTAVFETWEKDVRLLIQKYLNAEQYDFQKIGLHRTALSYAQNLIPEDRKASAIRSIKKHYDACFPNRMDAPRLSAPSKNCGQLITPYFSHFVFPLLLEAGEGEFVIGQYKSCWGWMLSQADATWLEVFDPRWSHCHEWSGCPTWQISTYILGLRRRFDLEENCFEFCAVRTGMKNAQGRIPAAGGAVQLRLCDGNYVLISSETDITVLHDGERVFIPAGAVRKLFIRDTGR